MKSEFDFIESIRKQKTFSSVKFGIGDDCAVISKDKKTDLVMTTDLLVEDIDFRREWMIAEYLGHKALAVSLSDIAAMGAKPVWAMLSIGIPEDIWKTDFIEKFYKGWFKLAKKYKVQLIGGDVSRTPDKIVIDSIAAGDVKRNRAILRSGAKVNDLIFVSGELGGASFGLKTLEAGERFTDDNKNKNVILRQLRPNPQIELAQILAKYNLATAMIDLSDGISSDLIHLCRESNVGAEVFSKNIPIDKNLTSNTLLDSFSLSDASSFYLNGGEDFELLFTINPQNKKNLIKKLIKFSVTEIGKITDVKDQIILVKNDSRIPLFSDGYKHF